MAELLTVELVPRTSWYRNVRSNVPPEEWEKLKRITSQRAGHRCEICGGRGSRWPVECHEVWQYDDVQHIQKLIRLIALCPACHEVKHLGLAGTRGRSNEALAHLAKVNKWSMTDARHYVEACYELWYQRSNHKWTLDISYLDELQSQAN